MGEKEAWGQTTLIDLYDCEKDVLTSEEKLREFCYGLCERIGMKPFKEPIIDRFGEGDLEGYTAIQRIETSNISVHLDEVGLRAFVDIFSCRKFDWRAAEEFCKEYWMAGGSTSGTLYRGGG